MWQFICLELGIVASLERYDDTISAVSLVFVLSSFWLMRRHYVSVLLHSLVNTVKERGERYRGTERSGENKKRDGWWWKRHGEK